MSPKCSLRYICTMLHDTENIEKSIFSMLNVSCETPKSATYTHLTLQAAEMPHYHTARCAYVR